MEFVLGVACLLLFLTVLLPLDKIIQSKNLKKILTHMTQNETKRFRESSCIENRFVRIFALGEKCYKLFGISFNEKTKQKYQEKIEQMGSRFNVSVESFLGIKILLLMLMLVLGLVMVMAFGSSHLWTCLVCPILGFMLPDSVLNIKIRRRRDRMEKEIPYVLSTLAIITDAGLGLFEAIKKLCDAREGVLIDELSKVYEESRLGILHKDAFRRMAQRCQNREVTAFVFTISQNLEKGADGITQILKKQSEEMWGKRKNYARELGGQASVKLFMPMLLMLFPALLIFLLGPALVSISKIYLK